jgi:hypothetical protein
MKDERRGGEDIKKSILNYLNKRPSSVKNISDSIGGNWKTISNYLEELKNEKKVKEIISTDKVKYYQKITGDTYFDIPLDSVHKDILNYIYSKIIETFKLEKKIIPKRTELAKIAVDVIYDLKLEKEIPIVWYIYGQITLMIADPMREYLVVNLPNNKSEIDKSINKIIRTQNHANTHELKNDHYIKYGNEYYKTKEDLLHELGIQENQGKILDLFNKFYLNCPIDDNIEIFEFTERLYSIVGKLNCFNKFDENRVKIIVALECIWKLLASYTLIDSLSKYPKYKKEELIQFYIGPTIDAKKNQVEESLLELESIYLSSLTDKEIPLSEEAAEVRKIMADWTGE